MYLWQSLTYKTFMIGRNQWAEKHGGWYSVSKGYYTITEEIHVNLLWLR